MKDRLILQHTLGITTTNSTVVVYDSLLIYQAGASLVIYNYIEDKSRFIQLGSKQISCLDNHKNYLAIGEFGHQPKILIYDLNTDRLERSISGHKYGVLMAKFTPNGHYLITIGHHNDRYIMVWDWKSGRKIGSVKIATKVLGLAVDQSSKYFVTIGSKHIKYWDLSKLNV
jgi:WD40 repeat protein